MSVSSFTSNNQRDSITSDNSSLNTSRSRYSNYKLTRSKYFHSLGFNPKLAEPLVQESLFGINEESAKVLAEKLFNHYNRSESGKIEDSEARTMISDAYLITGKPNNSRVKEYKEYLAYHDLDGDGEFTLKDLENRVKKYLCGPGGFGINLSSDLTDNENYLKYIYKEIGKEKVDREIFRAKELFERFDEDNDGYLDENDVNKLLKETYQDLDPKIEFTYQDAIEYISNMNPSRDKKISEKEFEIGVIKALGARNIKF